MAIFKMTDDEKLRENAEYDIEQEILLLMHRHQDNSVELLEALKKFIFDLIHRRERQVMRDMIKKAMPISYTDNGLHYYSIPFSEELLKELENEAEKINYATEEEVKRVTDQSIKEIAPVLKKLSEE